MTFVYPVPSTYGLYVTDPFGTRRGLTYHKGTDYRAPTGTELYAIGDGVVEAVVHNDPRGGNYVRILLDDTSVRDARYSHMSRIDVPKGKRVRKGEIIGLSGATGNVTGAHLHFGMKNKAHAYIDPDKFLRNKGAVPVDYKESGSDNPGSTTGSKDDDVPQFRDGYRGGSQAIGKDRWTTIKVTDNNGVSTAFGPCVFSTTITMSFTAPSGTQLRGRFYVINYKTGERVRTYDSGSKADSPLTKGSTLRWTQTFKDRLGPDERLRFEVYAWEDDVRATGSSYSTLEW